MRIGFRTWTLTDENGEFVFHPVAIGTYRWKLVGANQAADYRKYPIIDESAGLAPVRPMRKNMAGFYHYYDANRALIEYDGRGLIGACMCWGRIGGKDGERMFRAEYAQILAVTEPVWDKFPKPMRPVMPHTLTERMWMVSVNLARAQLLNTPDSFRKYVESLATVLGVDPATLDIDQIHTKFRNLRGVAEEQHADYLAAVSRWESYLKDWDRERSERFRAQMPFPIFKTMDELAVYARKFGDLGPPDREVFRPLLTGE